MSLIEKIDKKIKWCEEMNKKAITIEFKNIKKGLEMAREIILSEQKEPCELELAKQIIQAEPKITLNKKEIDNVIGIRTDGKYCTFIDGYKITVENQ